MRVLRAVLLGGLSCLVRGVLRRLSRCTGSAHENCHRLSTKRVAASSSFSLQLFKYILEHLRAMSNNEPYSPLPEDAK